ncbi:MAG: TetR family transcriptional regulator C-terminal domain-containing protein [Rhodobacteraceae bacterium]|nr:TetR family transcriptional regulator C-terminal domain-containing protein [Paracoccaceae bacterium]
MLFLDQTVRNRPGSASGGDPLARAASAKTQTRIQKEKTELILSAALEVFASYGFRGTTIDQIAAEAGLSKPNLLYYFDSKDAIHEQLLEDLLDTWLDPLRSLDAEGDPVDEITSYVIRKLEMARDFPRESRLFANEILQGAPRIMDQIAGPLRELVAEKAAIITGWADAGRIAPVDPYHLIFSIWATTQHYADFDIQVAVVLGKRADQRFEDAAAYLTNLFTKVLRPSEG